MDAHDSEPFGLAQPAEVRGWEGGCNGRRTVGRRSEAGEAGCWCDFEILWMESICVMRLMLMLAGWLAGYV
jgi:hypothetical protein